MTIPETLSKAQDLQRAGRFHDAAVCYRIFLDADIDHADMDHADACYGLGTVLMQQNDLEGALDWLAKAHEREPGVPEFAFNLSLVLGRLGHIEACKKALGAAAANAGKDVFYLVPVAKKMLDYGMAREAYTCLHASGDQTDQVAILKAQALGVAGDWVGAVHILKALTIARPDEAGVWHELSRGAGFLRDYDMAIDAYKVYLSKKVPTGEDYLGFADLYLIARKPELARASLEQALGNGVDRAEAHYLAAKICRLDGDYDGVRTNVDKALERRPSFGHVWQLKFEVSDKADFPALAPACLTHAADPAAKPWDRVMLNLTAGRAFEKLGRYGEAFAAYGTGNAEHKEILAKGGFAYDPQETHAEVDRIISLFAERDTGARAPTNGEKTPFFIVGMPRSGTTLVEKIIGCYDGVTLGGESEAMEFTAARYYRARALGGMPMPDELGPTELNQLEAAYWNWTGPAEPYITDKMPHNFRHVGLIAKTFPAAPILYMVRDPRDVCLSIFSRAFPEAHRYACDLDWLAHFYAEQQRLKDHWMTVYPNRILEVVYEDLVAHPVERTQEIAAFCGLEWHPGCLDFHKQTSSSYTFSELQVRKPLNRDGIGRWRDYEAELRPLTDALVRYGVL